MATKKDSSVVLNDVNYGFSIHPGEILQRELRERKIKQKDFALQIGMEAPHLSALIHGNRSITAAIAARLEEALDISANIWMNLQNRYNLDKDRIKRQRYKDLVAGYHKSIDNHSALALAEPETELYGNQITLTISLSERDMNLLNTLANRLGWHLENSPAKTLA